MPNLPDSIRELIKQKSSSVRHLNLSNCGLDDNDCSELQELLQNNHYIESIDLSNNNIKANGCRFIFLIPKLQKVDFSYCSIHDEGVIALINSKNSINRVNLSNCSITEKGAKLLLENLDKFTSLEIIGNPRISSETLVKIRSKFVINPQAGLTRPAMEIDLSLAFAPLGLPVPNSTLEVVPYKDEAKNKESISNEKKLAEKIIKENESDLSKLNDTQKVQFANHFAKYLGIAFEPKLESPNKTFKT